jgi:hypothetical protein
MEEALKEIQGIKTPTADDMKYQVQKLVQQGILTPAQAQTYLQNPNALEGKQIDQTGTDAQKQGIAGLLSAAEQGGMDPNEQARIAEINRQTGTQEKGANDAVLQNQAARGALTSGETLAAQLQNNQNATVNANQNAGNVAGQAYQDRLAELTSAGNMGSGLQGQENTQSNTVGAATNAINQFNAAQQQQEENLNVANRNAAQEENLQNAQNISNTNVGNENAYSQYQAQLPEEVFNNEMQKATGVAGANQNAAALDTQQGGQEAALTGGLVGTAGQVGGAALMASEGGEVPSEIHNYLNGGVVDGKARVSGNSPKNDTVPAMLSPGEVVLPRTVAQHPQPDRVMEFLNRMRGKPKSPHPDDVATVLHALGKVREIQ